MMKKLFALFCLMWLTACSDSSPLRSNIEVEINKLFGTEFGVVDQVFIQSAGTTLSVLNPEEFLTYMELADEAKGKETSSEITIVLKTSKEMKEYSKEQDAEELSFNSDTNSICNEGNCYKATEELVELIDSLKRARNGE